MVLAACATVPTSGPIEEGPVVDAGESAQFIRVIAAPPSQGARPSDIVRGFLEANASLESDHAIARRYLTPPAAASWEPESATTVYEQASLTLAEGSGDSISAELAINGRLAADGTLDPVDPPQDERIRFHLEQVGDEASGIPQWRISDPPEGILVSDTDLRRVYRQYQVHHPSARGPTLVPDGRLLPVVGPSLPTALAERVLAGPAEWLAPGVRNSIPPGTALALGAVPVGNGVASVELTDQALAATDSQRQDLAAQLTWTLTQLPEVTAVRLVVGGEPYNVPGAPEVMERAVWQGRSPDALITGSSGSTRAPYYTLEGSSVVRVSEQSRSARPIRAPDAEALVDLGVSIDGSTAAAVRPDRRGMWILSMDADATEQLVEGADIAGASFDVDGHAWFTDAGRIRRLDQDGIPADVPVISDEVTGPVTSVQLARDGARLVLVLDGQLHLGVIRAGAEGPEVVSVRRIAATVTGVRDVAWRNSMTLDVLASTSSSDLQVLRVGVGAGDAQPVGAPPDPQEVAAAPGSATLTSTVGDLLFANVGLQWRAQGTARSVAYPG